MAARARPRTGAAAREGMTSGLVWSLLAHGVLVALVLMGGLVIPRSPPPAELGIKAVVVDPDALPARRPDDERRAAEERARELERQRLEEERRRQEETRLAETEARRQEERQQQEQRQQEQKKEAEAARQREERRASKPGRKKVKAGAAEKRRAKRRNARPSSVPSANAPDGKKAAEEKGPGSEQQEAAGRARGPRRRWRASSRRRNGARRVESGAVVACGTHPPARERTGTPGSAAGLEQARSSSQIPGGSDGGPMGP